MLCAVVARAADAVWVEPARDGNDEIVFTGAFETAKDPSLQRKSSGLCPGPITSTNLKSPSERGDTQCAISLFGQNMCPFGSDSFQRATKRWYLPST